MTVENTDTTQDTDTDTQDTQPNSLFDVTDDTDDNGTTDDATDEDSTEDSEDGDKAVDWEKRYKELYKLHRQKRPEVPEQTVDTVKAAMEKAGWQTIDPSENEANAAVYNDCIEDLKRGSFTQEQVDIIMEMGNKWMAVQAAASGPTVDIESERAALQKEWGHEYSQNFKATVQYATQNLPASVYNLPLSQTAEGLKFLHDYVKKSSPDGLLETSSVSKGQTIDELKTQMNELTSDPNYYKNSPEGRTLHAKMDQFAAKLAKLMGE